MATIGRRAYAEMYGPTVGDRLRLADTGLIVEVEQDGAMPYGSIGRRSAWLRDTAAYSISTRS